jgi:hypothetical protein
MRRNLCDAGTVIIVGDLRLIITDNYCRDTAVPSPLYHSGVTGIDITDHTAVPAARAAHLMNPQHLINWFVNCSSEHPDLENTPRGRSIRV